LHEQNQAARDQEKKMRSEYVFAAAKEINNRFLLCRVASVSARRLQMGSKQPSETINQSLQLIAAAQITEQELRQSLNGEPEVHALKIDLDQIVSGAPMNA
jgi:DNA-directed RNA polymerase subunit K/omega